MELLMIFRIQSTRL